MNEKNAESEAPASWNNSATNLNLQGRCKYLGEGLRMGSKDSTESRTQSLRSCPQMVIRSNVLNAPLQVHVQVHTFLSKHGLVELIMYLDLVTSD